MVFSRISHYCPFLKYFRKEPVFSLTDQVILCVKDLINPLSEFLEDRELGILMRTCKAYRKAIMDNNYLWKKRRESVLKVNALLVHFLKIPLNEVVQTDLKRKIQAISQMEGCQNAYKLYATTRQLENYLKKQLEDKKINKLRPGSFRFFIDKKGKCIPPALAYDFKKCPSTEPIDEFYIEYIPPLLSFYLRYNGQGIRYTNLTSITVTEHIEYYKEKLSSFKEAWKIPEEQFSRLKQIVTACFESDQKFLNANLS